MGFLENRGGGAPERCLTRRSFVQTGLRVASLGVISLAFCGPMAAFAGDEGGGTGGEEGSGGSGQGSAQKSFLWFDRGGFVDAGGYEPTQGWDTASADYFKGLMESHIGHTMSTRYRPPFGKNNDRLYYDSAEQALQNARNRAGTEHARVVGVGWWWFADEDYGHPDQFAFATPDDSWWSTWETLMQRPGNVDELPNECGWGDIVDGTSENWRDYIWNLGSVDTPGHLYTVVVAAVADNEPPGISLGSSGVMKAASNPSWL